MSGFLLDTNVISEFARPDNLPDQRVKHWLEAADPDSQPAGVSAGTTENSPPFLITEARTRSKLYRGFSRLNADKTRTLKTDSIPLFPAFSAFLFSAHARTLSAALLLCFVLLGCGRKEWTRDYGTIRNTVKQLVLKNLSKETPANQSFWKLKNIAIFGNDGVGLIFAGKIEVEGSNNRYYAEFPVWCKGEDPSGQKVKRTMVVEVFLDQPDHITSYRAIEGAPLSLSEQIKTLVWMIVAITIIWSPIIFALRFVYGAFMGLIAGNTSNR